MPGLEEGAGRLPREGSFSGRAQGACGGLEDGAQGLEGAEGPRLEVREQSLWDQQGFRGLEWPVGPGPHPCHCVSQRV